MATKYKSQVTNKWIGSSYKGTVRHQDAKTTEMGQIVSALRNDFTPALNNWGEKHIEKKQTEAGAKMEELYAKGWTTKNIHKAILNDEIPELSSQYTKSVVDTHSGRFEAVNTIREIRANADDYNYKETSGTIEEFWKKYLPNFEGASKEFTTGFSATFNEWAADEKIDDAKLRAGWAHEKKIMNGVKFLDTFAKQDMSTYWKQIKTLNTAMPIEGKGKAYYFDSDEMNEVAMAHVQWILDTTENPDDIAVAMQILITDRGTGTGGNKLGSLISTRDPEVGALYQKLELKEAQLTQKIRKDEEYNKNKDVEDIWAEAFEQVPVSATADMKGADSVGMRNKNILELNKIQDKLKQFNDPLLIDTFGKFFSEDRTITNEPSVTTAFMGEIAEGKFDTYAEMVAEMTARGIPKTQLTTANARWKTWISNKDKGTSPIYFSDITYSKSMPSIEASVLQSFTEGVVIQKGGKEAVINARNYMKDQILSYEKKFFDANGTVPNWEERRKYMTDLGKHVMEVFRANPIPEPAELISMEDKDIKEEKVTTLRKDKQVEEKAEQLKKNIETLVDSGTIKLPARKEDPSFDDYIPFNEPSAQEFYEEKVKPIVEGYVTQILDGLGLDSTYFGKEKDDFIPAFTAEEQVQFYNVIAKSIFGENWKSFNNKQIQDIIEVMLGIKK
jgi:hypothetical protein